MPVENIRGVNIVYEIVGDRGPWVVLITGGRRAHDEFVPLAQKIAAGGFRVLLHDRRNTGASDIRIDGSEAEEEIWTDDLHELFRARARCRCSSAARRRARAPRSCSRCAIRKRCGACCYSASPAAHLRRDVCRNNITANISAPPQQGGMAAVCDTEQYRERIAANPKNRDVLMAMDPKRYIAVMEHWLKLFQAGANFTIMGVTDDQLRSIKAPTVVIPGNDNTHNSASGRAAQKLIPGSKLHQLPIEDKDVPLISFEEWAPYEAEIAKTFVDFMRGVAGSMAA